jgi:hypothetical protein
MAARSVPLLLIIPVPADQVSVISAKKISVTGYPRHLYSIFCFPGYFDNQLFALFAEIDFALFSRKPFFRKP